MPLHFEVHECFMRNAFKKIKPFAGDLSGRALAFIHDAASLPTKAQAAVLTLSLMASSHAMASGFTGFFAGWKGAAQSLVDFATMVGVAIGVISCLVGIMKLIKKGKSNDQTEWPEIIWPIVGGALCTVVVLILNATVETGGASTGEMGKTLQIR